MINLCGVAEFVERYGLRVAAGPAKRTHAMPVNLNRAEPDVAAAIVQHTRALAGMLRAGIVEPEQDWPALPATGEEGIQQ